MLSSPLYTSVFSVHLSPSIIFSVVRFRRCSQLLAGKTSKQGSKHLGSGVATGLWGCGPHRAALARGGKGAKKAEFFLNSRENSDCKFHMCLRARKTKRYGQRPSGPIVSYYVGSLAASSSNFDFVGVSVMPISCCGRSVHTGY